MTDGLSWLLGLIWRSLNFSEQVWAANERVESDGEKTRNKKLVGQNGNVAVRQMRDSPEYRDSPAPYS